MPLRLFGLVLGWALSCTQAKAPKGEEPISDAHAFAGPTKPSQLQAEVRGQSISLRWQAIAGAEKYHMQWASEAAPEILLGQASITTPQLTVHDLDEGRYIFRVAMETPNGPGPMETIVAAVQP